MFDYVTLITTPKNIYAQLLDNFFADFQWIFQLILRANCANHSQIARAILADFQRTLSVNSAQILHFFHRDFLQGLTMALL